MLKKNIINLFTNQLFSYIVPLLLLPYLSRILSIKYLGLYILSLSFINFGSILINYGFDISVSKRIAEGEKSQMEIGVFLFEISIIKFILSIISVSVIIVINIITQYFSNIEISIICLSLVATSFNLNWLFQGIEKIYIFSRITILTKILTVILIFLFVNNDDDFILILILNLLQAILSILIAYYIIFKWNVYPIKSSVQSIFFLAKQSTEYFMSRLGVSLYSTSCSFFLGIFGGSLQQVAIYGIAEQLYRAGIYTLSAISTPLIPYMARTKNYHVFFRMLIISLVITIIGSTIGIIFGNDIIILIFGHGYEESKSILNIFMIVIPISISGVLFGYPALIPLQKTKVANFSVIYAGILQLLLIFIIYSLSIKFTALLVVSIYLACETFVLILRLGTFVVSYKDREKL